MNDDTLLRRAIHLAELHSRDGRNGPFGAVVALDGEVVGEGWNQVVGKRDPTAHAEIQAIREASTRLATHVLAECTIYCSCEPCPMCLAAIYWARIPRILFAASGVDAERAGFDDRVIARELCLPSVERTVDCSQRLREEGSRVLRGWSRTPGRQEY